MSFYLEIVFGFFLIWFVYKWFEFLKLKRKLKWVRDVPSWPIVGTALEFGDNSETIYDLIRLHSKYGKLILLDVLWECNIVATDYDFIELVLSTQQILNKSTNYRFLHRWLGKGLLTSDGPKWKKSRKMITPAFHFSILEQFVEYFHSNGKILIEYLEKEVGKDGFDIYPFITLYTLDIICETAMGVSVNAQRNKNSQYVKNVKEMLRIGIDRAFSVFKYFDMFYMFSKDYYKELRAVNQLHSITYSVIDSKRKELNSDQNKETEENAQDEFGRKRKLAFLDIMLKSTVDGRQLSREEIREEVDTFMLEGHDTTASAISFALHTLASHPEVQNRVVEEQKKIFGDDVNREASYNDLTDMKYLELVIKETLRLFPSVPMFGRSTTEDIVYKGQIIPKGVNITIFSYGILRDPDNYSDPDTFNPDRFEHSDGKRPYTYIPFSAGPRNCIGQRFAMLEIKSTLSKILRNFELHPPPQEQKIILVAEAVLKSKNGIRLKLTKRKW